MEKISNQRKYTKLIYKQFMEKEYKWLEICEKIPKQIAFLTITINIII